jgi:hypothetical protein
MSRSLVDGVGAPFTKVVAAARAMMRVRRLTMLLVEDRECELEVEDEKIEVMKMPSFIPLSRLCMRGC